MLKIFHQKLRNSENFYPFKGNYLHMRPELKIKYILTEIQILKQTINKQIQENQLRLHNTLY